MTLTLYQIDAFAEKIFKGNPAAVIPLEKWIDVSLMQNLAMENNLAETVFFVQKPGGESHEYEIRWFTPEAEINLCGHATLASAYVLWNKLSFKGEQIRFHSASGPLDVTRDGETILLNFPSWEPKKIEEFPDDLCEMLGIKEFVGVYQYRDLLIELNTEDDVLKAKPNFTRINETGLKMIITARGKSVDFVSRFFAPSVGVNEDPVTGSAHSQLIPFWSNKLGKTKMIARQLSKRGGQLTVEHLGDRVLMGGTCVSFLKGTVTF